MSVKKAYDRGCMDGLDFATEYPATAQKALIEGLWGAHRTLIAALGVDRAAEIFGVDVANIEEFARCCTAYSWGWASGVISLTSTLGGEA